MKKIAILLISSVFLAGCNRLDIHQPMTSTVTKFSEGEAIAQSFISSRANLNTVSICLRNIDRALIPMTFILSEQGTVVRTIDFSSGNIDNEDCTKFKFTPIPDSQGKSYVATISSLPPDKNKLLPAVLTIEKFGEDLHYKTFYYQPLSEVTLESLIQFYRRLSLDPFFILMYLAGMIYLIIRLLKTKS